MAVPTNLSAATALEIPSLPYSVTLDAFEVPTDSLWFSYALPAAGGYVATMLAAPVPLGTGTYHPYVEVFTGTPSSLTPYNGGSAATENESLSIPLPPDATTFYIQVSQGFGGAFTEQLQFDMVGAATAPAPAESIFVSDDSHGFPGVAISSTTGAILQTFPFPSGETADRLSTGVNLWHDASNDVLELFSPQFVPLATVTWAPLTALPNGQAPIQAGPSQFYVGHPGKVSGPTVNAVVTTVSAAGVLGPSTWDLGAPNVFALAVNRAETVLYYRKTTSGLDSAVKRWDLVNNLALSDLIATVPGYSVPADLIVLDDDTLLVAYRAVVGSNVKRYSSAGVLLNTFALASPLNRVARSSDNLTTFWVWMCPDSDTSRFQQIRISDGAILHDVTSPQSDDGVLRPDSTVPTQGPSNSCPFLTTPEALPAITTFLTGTPGFPAYGPGPQASPPECPGLRGAPLPGV